MSDEKHNASQMPRIFYARHMQPGIVGYGDETILVDTAALKKLISSTSGKGIPVYLYHNEESQESRLKNLKDQAVGYVTDSFYNELDGWAWFKFIAVEDAAHDAIDRRWSVSNAYVPSRWGSGGTKNNLPYHREVLDGEFTHLAIVPDPRYEDACIFSPEQFKAYQEKLQRQITELQNAKSDSSKGTPMFKFFQTKREEVSADAVTPETQVELQNGKTVTVAEMVEAIVNSKKSDAFVTVGDEKMTVADLITRYSELSNSKKEEEDCKMNESEEDEEEEKEKKEKKNRRKERKNKGEHDGDEDEEEEETEEMQEKKNSHFDELKNANRKASQPVQKIETSMDQVARGKARYGSEKAA